MLRWFPLRTHSLVSTVHLPPFALVVSSLRGLAPLAATAQARDLRIELQSVLNDLVLSVRETAFTVSVQPDSASDKGRLVDEVLRGVRAQHSADPCDFVFFCGAFGHDRAAFRRLAELEQVRTHTYYRYYSSCETFSQFDSLP